MENLLVISKNSALTHQICDPLRVHGYQPKQIESFTEALNILRAAHYSSVFADKQILDVGEQEFVETIRKINSSTKVIFFNSENQQPINFWTMQCFSFEDPQLLSQKLKLILHPTADHLKNYLSGQGYSSKQIQILLMISHGESNKAIAEVLKISEQGVKYHVGVLLKVFKMENRKELQKHLKDLFD